MFYKMILRARVDTPYFPSMPDGYHAAIALMRGKARQIYILMLSGPSMPVAYCALFAGAVNICRATPPARFVTAMRATRCYFATLFLLLMLYLHRY